MLSGRGSLLAAAALGLFLFHPSARSESPGDAALRSLLGKDSSTFPFDLDRSRPSAVTSEFKARVLGELPQEGRVQKLDEPERRKLASLEPVLRVQQRHLVYEITVCRARQALVALLDRSILLISDKALKLLSSEELQALVAHEIGHEYVWGQHREAEKHQDSFRSKELELFCDGIAILTLRRVGVDPQNLLTGLSKLSIFNRTRVGVPDNGAYYPSFDEREKFARAMMRWAGGAGPAERPQDR